MKNNALCPKCESHKIIRVPAPKYSEKFNNAIGVGWMKVQSVRVTRYLCCHCGYSEEWIDDPKDIAKIEKSYDDHELDEYV